MWQTAPYFRIHKIYLMHMYSLTREWKLASDMSVLEAAISSDAEHIKLEKQTEVLASQVLLKLLKLRDQFNIISIGAYLIPGIPRFHFLQCDLHENRLPNREGCCRWRSISQILLQMQPWTLHDQSIKLHNSRASALLSSPPLSALKQKGNFSQRE
ncbi:hypothetical protein Droror1_Dr00024100 [Drosera rotundifolia]